MATLSLSEGLKKFKIEAEENLLKLMRQSTQDLAREANTPIANGGRMPVDTGFLRNSLVITMDGESDPPFKGQGLNKDQLRAQGRTAGPAGNLIKLAGSELGDIVYLTWTAHYAMYVERGGRGPARLFAQGAADKWPFFVERNARRLASG